MINYKKILNKKKILVTGHTGFKGSWLVTWLVELGARVVGLSNKIPSNPSHYNFLNLNKKIINKRTDIRNLQAVKNIFLNFQPDFVFHLAAQSLVKESYKDPLKTWSTNTLGTISILESLRLLRKKCVVVIITSDKVYENFEIKRGYSEKDRLGGKDPYSSSKAAADIAIKSYVNSFFSNVNNNIFVATARAGNVIGGGDWSSDRLIPDCVKSWSQKKKVLIRSPNSTRPWQHVIEAVYGYIILAANLYKNPRLHGEAFNFGPTNSKNYNVISVVELMKNYWKDVNWCLSQKKVKTFKEFSLLKLNSNKAKKLLKWRSILTIKENIFLVANWYKNFYLNRKQAFKLTTNQIKEYQKLLHERKL